jgi:hypothetical protein
MSGVFTIYRGWQQWVRNLKQDRYDRRSYDEVIRMETQLSSTPFPDWLSIGNPTVSWSETIAGQLQRL